MRKCYKSFKIAGATDDIVWGDDLISSKKEPKTLLGILITVTGYQDNTIEVWMGKERIASIYDKLLDTIANTGTTSTMYSTVKQTYIDFDTEIPVGEKIIVGLRCGASATNVYGAYVYTPVETK